MIKKVISSNIILTATVFFIVVLMVGYTAVQPDTGSFVDSSDGQTYRTVRIGKQTWMAEKKFQLQRIRKTV